MTKKPIKKLLDKTDKKDKKDKPKKPRRSNVMLRVGRPLEWTHEIRIAEGIALVEWAKLDTSLTINSFSVYREPPYTTQQLYAMAETSKELSESIAQARQIISARRESGGLTGKLESSLVGKTLTHYDKQFATHVLEMKAKEMSMVAETLSAGEIIDHLKKKKKDKLEAE